MPRPTKLTDEARVKLREIARIRAQNIPNKTLARALGISERTVNYHLQRFLREVTVPRGAISEDTHANSSSSSTCSDASM